MRGFPVYQRQEEYKGIGVVPMQERPFFSPLQGLDEAGREMVETGRLMQRQQQQAHRMATLAESTAQITEIQHALDQEIAEGKWPDAGALKEEFEKRVTNWYDQVDLQTQKIIDPEVKLRRQNAWYNLEENQFSKRAELEKTRVVNSIGTIIAAAVDAKNDEINAKGASDAVQNIIQGLPDAYFRGGALEKQNLIQNYQGEIWKGWFQNKIDAFQATPGELQAVLNSINLTPDQRNELERVVNRYTADFKEQTFLALANKDPWKAKEKLESWGFDLKEKNVLGPHVDQMIRVRENQKIFEEEKQKRAYSETENLKYARRIGDLMLNPSEEGYTNLISELRLSLEKGYSPSAYEEKMRFAVGGLQELHKQSQDLIDCQTRLSVGLLPANKDQTDALYRDKMKSFLTGNPANGISEIDLKTFQSDFLQQTGSMPRLMADEIKSAVMGSDIDQIDHYSLLFDEIKRFPKGRLAYDGLDESLKIFFHFYDQNKGKPSAYKLAFDQAYPEISKDREKVLDKLWEGKGGLQTKAYQIWDDFWKRENDGMYRPTADMRLAFDEKMLEYKHRINGLKDLEEWARFAIDDVRSRFQLTFIGKVPQDVGALAHLKNVISLSHPPNLQELILATPFKDVIESPYWLENAPEKWGIDSRELNKYLEEDLNTKGWTMKPEGRGVWKLAGASLGAVPPLSEVKEPGENYQSLSEVWLQFLREEQGYPLYRVLIKKIDGVVDYVTGKNGRAAEWPSPDIYERLKVDLENRAKEESQKTFEQAQKASKDVREVIQYTLEHLNQ